MNGYKFKRLRENSNLLQKQVAIDLHISPSTIAMYEQNRRDPDNNTLKNIANYFGVSTDYLLDNENSKLKNEMDTIKNNLLLEILRDYKIINSNEELSKEKIDKIMNFIKINIDYLK